MKNKLPWRQEPKPEAKESKQPAAEDRLNVAWSANRMPDGQSSYEAAGAFKPLVDSVVQYIATAMPYLAISAVYLTAVDGMFGSQQLRLGVDYFEEDVPHHSARANLLEQIKQLMILHNIARVEVSPDDPLLEKFKPVWDGTLEPLFDQGVI